MVVTIAGRGVEVAAIVYWAVTGQQRSKDDPTTKRKFARVGVDFDKIPVSVEAFENFLDLCTFAPLSKKD